MEGFHRGDEAVFAGVQAGDFKGALNRFRPAGDEKGMVDVAGRDLGQQLGQHPAQGIHELLAGDTGLEHLCPHRLDHLGWDHPRSRAP